MESSCEQPLVTPHTDTVTPRRDPSPPPVGSLLWPILRAGVLVFGHEFLQTLTFVLMDKWTYVVAPRRCPSAARKGWMRGAVLCSCTAPRD